MQENNKEVLNEENVLVNQPLLLGAIDKILVKKSIARRVSDIQQLKGPVGIITGAEYDKATDKLKIAKADITASTKKIRTEFTQEAIQDLKGIYNESFYDLLAHYLVDEMAYQIDAEFITMVKTRAETKTPLDFPGVNFNENLLSVGRSIAIRVTRGLADLPISDNRSPKGWAIVSSNIASVLGLTTNVNENVEAVDGKNADDDNSPSYLGALNGVDYYVDYTHPNNGIDSVVFGIKGNGISKGSTIYAPYRQDWLSTVDATSGEEVFFLMHRSGMIVNPLDEKYYNAGAGTSAFLGKFNVDLQDLQVFA